ncbi:heavy metal translocating P-type ATPase [Streptococcaceae bacterium ESL0687]|nr:heavy metal translocating P-type ATPase [Streptococcaceae bacterium ESL0687]
MKNWQKLILVFVVAIIALFSRFVLHNNYLAETIVTVVGLLLAGSMFIGMIKTIKSGSYGVDILAITAILSTLAIGEYWASLIIIVMLVGGDSLEDYAAHRASRELDLLISKSPVRAHLQAENGQVTDIDVTEIKVGDVLLVKPLELVPVDGKLLSTEAEVDQSSLTGESKPVKLAKDQEILSGSINGDSKILIQATKLAKDSKYQQIVSLVKEIKEKPAHFVRMADQYAVPFTIISYTIAGLAWIFTRDVHRFVEVLVVASPCPLILAAPIAFIAGMSRLSRNNVLVKSGTVIEKLAAIKTAYFDKTGTLTKGDMAIDQVIPASKDYSQTDILRLAASLEQASNHILSQSIIKGARDEQLTLPQADDLKEIAGEGLTGQINGKLYKIGRDSFIGLKAAPDASTSVYLSENGNYIGKITFTDEIRPDAKEVVSDMTGQLGIKNVIMLTGDDKTVAAKVAGELGIPKFYGELMPEEKLDIIKKTPADEKPVMMVGDGINDAPSLAFADVGVAIGSKGDSTIASESADLVILKNDLSSLVKSIKISRDTMKIARQSVWIGISICIILMLVASTGLIPAIVGACLQEIVDTITILHALTALKDRK